MAAAALLPVPAVAQGTVAGRAEAVFWNRHHWRGIRRAEVPVFSAGGVVALRLGGRGALSLGGTGRFELAESRPGRPSDLPFGRWGLSEGAVRVGLDTPGIGVGILWTGHPRRGDVGYVTEATLRLEHASRDLTPRLDLAWDLGGRRGGYLEASLRRVIANPVAGPGVNLVLDLSTGLAFDTDSARARAAGLPTHFSDGFTHTDLGLGLRLDLPLGGLDLLVDVVPHVQLSWDDSARQPSRERFWVEASIGVGLPGRVRP